ncbi:MAG: glycosyltransferase family 4 protein [Patescibacteria group bacterium]|jgi:phosphatidylinositol alpha-1,6-mannosyltransferase
MLKTLLITTDFPPKIGGVSEYLSQICSRLPRENITVLTTAEDNSDIFDAKQNYRIIRKKLFSTSYFVWPKWILLLRNACRLVKSNNFRQILVGQILPVGTVALIINYLFKIPYIVSTHAMDITILESSPRKTWLAKKILNRSTQIITVSHYTKSKITDLGIVENKIIIISPATDILEHSTNDQRKELSDKYHLHNKRILLTVGRIIERKGHMDVLKALPDIIKLVPNVNYVITSEGPYKAVLEDYILKNNLENHVTFIGTISRDELPSLYQLSELFVMPTRVLANNDVEGFGIVYLEANAFGIPVIAYNSGGVSDAVLHKKTGLLVEPKKPSEIAKCVINLLGDTAYAKQLGEQGKKRVKEQFGWNAKAQAFRDIL